MRSMARSGFALAVVVGLAAACGSTGASPASTAAPTTAPIVTPSPAPTPAPAQTTAPTPTPVPPTDGQGDELVIGTITSAVLSTPYTRTKVDRTDGVTEELRGGIVTFSFATNDVRATGTATFTFAIDLYTVVGSDWATLNMATDKGAWAGPCSGGSWSEGDGLLVSCSLAGSGDYSGYTFYLVLTGPDDGALIKGIIYPGPPPEG